MQSFLQQFSLKDLLTYLLLGLSIWYNTQNNQASRDAEQDKQLALQQQSITIILEATKETNNTLKEVRDELLTQREKFKNIK